VGSKHDYPKVLLAIAQGIGGLRRDFPQLDEFLPSDHADPKSPRIAYAFHTHRPQGRAGWTSGVPNPDDDGVWFYIDFHDPGSMAQIHTQPLAPKGVFGDKRVMFLILEGPETKPLAGSIRDILRRNGVKLGQPIRSRAGL
jgi:hypothetical protein